MLYIILYMGITGVNVVIIYIMTFKLAPPVFPCECEFKGHAIIARKGGEPGNEATVLASPECLAFP